jgi:hypothetical protein
MHVAGGAALAEAIGVIDSAGMGRHPGEWREHIERDAQHAQIGGDTAKRRISNRGQAS